MSAASMLQLTSTVLVNLCFALVMGTLTARMWLRGSVASARHAYVVARLRRAELVVAIAGVIAAVLSLWAASAVMMDGALGDALAMLWTMAIQTAYGQSGLVGLLLLAAFIALSAVSRTRGRPGIDVAMGLLLLAFAASRASVSHAGEGGMLTLAFGVEWIHLVLIALWVGGVAIGGWLVVPLADSKSDDRLPIARYLVLLSHAATVALAGIVATGLYNAWQRVGVVHNLVGNLYGTALIVKLSFVAAAMALGGYNKLWGFPALIRSPESDGRVIAILRVESILLLGALVAAAVLTTNQPPMAT